jgi:hypothetical protein
MSYHPVSVTVVLSYLEIRYFDASGFGLFVNNCFGYYGSFVLPHEFCGSVKNITGILMGIAVTLLELGFMIVQRGFPCENSIDVYSVPSTSSPLSIMFS